MNLFEEIREIVCKQLRVKPEEVKPEASIINDLGADSLGVVELVIALEEHFYIGISDEDAEKMWTVSDIIKYIEVKVKIS